MTGKIIIDFPGDFILDPYQEDFDMEMLRKYFYDQHNLVFAEEDFQKLLEINREHVISSQKNRIRVGDLGQWLFQTYYREYAIGTCAKCLRPVGKWWMHRNILCEYVEDEAGKVTAGVLLRDDKGYICLWCAIDFANIVRFWYMNALSFGTIIREYIWHYEKERLNKEWRKRIIIAPMKEVDSEWITKPSFLKERESPLRNSSNNTNEI